MMMRSAGGWDDDNASLLRGAFPDMRLESAGAAVLDGRQACLPWRFVGATHSQEKQTANGMTKDDRHGNPDMLKKLHPQSRAVQ